MPIVITQEQASASLTDEQLRATPVPVATEGLTDEELRATAVAISAAALPLPTDAATQTTLALIKAKTDNLDVALSTRAVTGLTDAELRAVAVPVSGPLTDAQLRAVSVPVSASSLPLPTGASTDVGLAAIFGRQGDGSADTSVNNFPATQAISAAALPLPAGAATEATLLTRTKPADQQHAIVDSSALPTGASTEATLAAIKAKTDNLDVALSTRAVTGLTDTQIRATPLPVSASSLPLPTGAATEVSVAALTKPSDQQHAIIDSSALPTDAATQTTLALIKAKTDNLDVALSTRAVTGLTDTQIRATPLPVSGPVTDAQLRATAVPVSVAVSTGTLSNGVETPVSSSAVSVLAAQESRKKAILQNTGTANVRVGVTGVTATSGIRLVPGGSVTFDLPNVPVAALFAIREGSVDSIVLAMEIV